MKPPAPGPARRTKSAGAGFRRCATSLWGGLRWPVRRWLFLSLQSRRDLTRLPLPRPLLPRLRAMRRGSDSSTNDRGRSWHRVPLGELGLVQAMTARPPPLSGPLSLPSRE